MSRTLILGATLLLCATASAQPRGHDRRELRQDRRELANDKAETRDDIHDLRVLEALLNEFDGARARFDQAALMRVDQRVRDQIAREIEESKQELRKDVREVRRDQREVREERREVRRDVNQGRPWAAGDDRRDLRDDRRDMRQDVRDAQVERASLDRQQQILREFDALYGRMDPPGLERKRALLQELVGLARGEVRRDVKEIREDRREMREDVRESRERH